ncbi:hypothetical protein [Salinirussus salinus]|jgi:hypothetical protein|uniref:hypothetical protein n=1 Tax=Salinirussus salinus TaxID=1198300 RepID=UPI0013573383|nr:hypothetical protein [Salinirussus salinus]
MADWTGQYTRTLPHPPRSLVRGLSAGAKAYFLALFGTAVAVEVGAAAGLHGASVPLLAPFLLVFWVYGLHASLGGYAAGSLGSPTVIFGAVLVCTLVVLGYVTAGKGEPATVVSAVARGMSLAVGYLPVLVLSHVLVAATVPSVSPFDAVAIRLFVDVGALYPVVFGGLGGFLYGWWSLPAGSKGL